jgi:hypothetical protein
MIGLFFKDRPVQPIRILSLPGLMRLDTLLQELIG